MKKALCMALVGSLVCAVSASAQTEVTYELVDLVDGVGGYEVYAEITGGDTCYGLGLVGFDVRWTVGTVGGQMANGGGDMLNFQNTAGLNNPAGFGGTTSGGLLGALLQVGGGQNTIGNTVVYAPYPIGTTVEGVGNSGAVLVATGNGVCDVDTIKLENCFANVLDDTGGPVYAVSAATVLGCDVEVPLTCGLAGCATLTAAYSMGTHGAAGDLELELVDGEKNVEPRHQGVTGELWIELQFDAAVTPADFDVVINPDPGVGYQLEAGDVGTELKLTYDAEVPEGDYDVVITCAGARDGGGFCVAYNKADVDNSGVVGGLDKAAIIVSWGQAADSNPPTTTRADVDRSGTVAGLDAAEVSIHWGHSASCP